MSQTVNILDKRHLVDNGQHQTVDTEKNNRTKRKRSLLPLLLPLCSPPRL